MVMQGPGLGKISGIGGLGSPEQSPVKGGDDDGAFGSMLSSLNSVTGSADSAVTDLAVGGDMDLHDVVLAVEMESIAFDLAVQIRNRLLEAYQEVMRIQV